MACGLITVDGKQVPELGIIARCNKDIAYRVLKPGLVYFDIDPRKGPDGKQLSRRELDNIFCKALRGFEAIERSWCPSSSAHLKRHGVILKGEGSYRLYFLIDDASAIRQVFDYFFQKLWLMGYGYVEIDGGGSLQPRTLIDECSKKQAQLDFISEPVCHDEIVRDVPDIFPVFRGMEPMLLSRMVPEVEPLTRWKRTDPQVLAKKADLRASVQLSFTG
jgi:hypothetical protein